MFAGSFEHEDAPLAANPQDVSVGGGCDGYGGKSGVTYNDGFNLQLLKDKYDKMVNAAAFFLFFRLLTPSHTERCCIRQTMALRTTHGRGLWRVGDAGHHAGDGEPRATNLVIAHVIMVAPREQAGSMTIEPESKKGQVYNRHSAAVFDAARKKNSSTHTVQRLAPSALHSCPVGTGAAANRAHSGKG
jgi:hypothetical protein